MPYSDYSYLDPIHIVWRAGTEDDPYIDRIEFLKISQHKIVLSEIPDRNARVKIAGMIEINYEGIQKKSIAPNEFSVNYSTGVIQLHASQESKSANCIYKGRGFIQYPSSRIYHQDEMNGVVESLDKIITDAISGMKDIDAKVSTYEQVKSDLLNTVAKSESATTEAKEASANAKVATDKALDAYDTTRLVFKPYVMLQSEIATKYPSPEIGWTVQVYDTGIRYRFDGISWIPIDLFGGAIPLADETIDGLLSKSDYSKLRKIHEATYSKRVLVFVLPSSAYQGIQPIVARFPFDGKVVGIKALCGIKGSTDTEIAIERSTDIANWNTIMQSNVVIKGDNFFDNGTAKISNDVVGAGDLFRVNVIQQGTNVQNITIDVIIETIN